MPVAAGQGEANVDVAVNGTGSARDKLLGWRVVAVKCLSNADGTRASSNANCIDLLDYRDHELAGQQLILIKKYGIYAQGKVMIGGVRQQLIDDVRAGLGEHQQLLIKVNALTELVQGIYATAVPEGNAVQHVTAKIIYDLISAIHDGREVIRSVAEHDWLSTLATLTPDLNPVVAAGKTLYGLAQNMKTLNEQQELQETF